MIAPARFRYDDLSDDVAFDVHTFDSVAWEGALHLQRRLVYEISGQTDRRAVVLLAEHEPLVTIGRKGSRADVRMSTDFARVKGIDVRWVARGGGAVLHGPGQLAIYLLAPLERWGMSAGDYLARMQTAARTTLEEFGALTRAEPGGHGLWGKSGQLAAFGSLVRGGVSLHGMWLNVTADVRWQRLIESTPSSTKPTMGSLVAEGSRPARMPEVRAAMIRRLADAFDARRCDVHLGHPLLPRVATAST